MGLQSWFWSLRLGFLLQFLQLVVCEFSNHCWRSHRHLLTLWKQTEILTDLRLSETADCVFSVSVYFCHRQRKDTLNDTNADKGAHFWASLSSKAITAIQSTLTVSDGGVFWLFPKFILQSKSWLAHVSQNQSLVCGFSWTFKPKSF